ncbi:hypothetical protein AAFF_G00093990 [Aldrovandia affinis]|uniref:Uncharacterized protein n=1 Tax=Aldrovandia affinis TaxID=143900 RepID=A0AAD7T3M3_9TELE|nr:hypothetical protein AAFF_G00093990 [Aldrovandia affinis]
MAGHLSRCRPSMAACLRFLINSIRTRSDRHSTLWPAYANERALKLSRGPLSVVKLRQLTAFVSYLTGAARGDGNDSNQAQFRSRSCSGSAVDSGL